ncbi:MAG: hypothetical protein AABM64_15120 [Pseudomonadota bacterium]
MSGRAVLNLGQLLAMLRPARNRKAAIALLNAKVRPQIARMDKAQLQEALAQAVLDVHRLQVENDSFVESVEQGETLHRLRSKRRFIDIAVAHSQAIRKGAKRARVEGEAKVDPYRVEAVRLAEAGKYTSRSHAARVIAAPLEDLSKKKWAHRTIIKWLKDGGYDPRRK